MYHPISKNRKSIYDYRQVKRIKIHIEGTGKSTYDSMYAMPREYFDGFLSEYILGALSMDLIQTIEFDIYRGDTKKEGVMYITKVTKDMVLLDNGKYSPSGVIFHAKKIRLSVVITGLIII